MQPKVKIAYSIHAIIVSHRITITSHLLEGSVRENKGLFVWMNDNQVARSMLKILYYINLIRIRLILRPNETLYGVNSIHSLHFKGFATHWEKTFSIYYASCMTRDITYTPYREWQTDTQADLTAILAFIYLVLDRTNGLPPLLTDRLRFTLPFTSHGAFFSRKKASFHLFFERKNLKHIST